jgi:hypothetical protein
MPCETASGGRASFWSALRIDPLNVSLRLLTISADLKAGERIVFRARQHINLAHMAESRTVPRLENRPSAANGPGSPQNRSKCACCASTPPPGAGPRRARRRRCQRTHAQRPSMPWSRGTAGNWCASCESRRSCRSPPPASCLASPPIRLRDYAIGTLALLLALCGYVFIGTLADTGLSAWSTGAGPVRWRLLGIGGLATLLLIVRLGQIVVKLGLASSAAGALEFTSTPAQAADLPLS